MAKGEKLKSLKNKITGTIDKAFDSPQVSKEETMTVGTLKNIISKLKEKANEKNLDPKTVKKIVALSNKYQQAINKTALLYSKNKHKQAIKGYKLSQLSYAKILQLLGKNVVVNEKPGMVNGLKKAFTQHPIENSLMAIGASSAFIGIMGKLDQEALKAAFSEILKFLFTDGMAPITIGGGLLAGVLVTKAVRKAKEQNAMIKEEAEANASGLTGHEEEVEKATVQEDTVSNGEKVLGRTSIASQAYRDPVYLEHITEIAQNTKGAYSPTQIRNARLILKEIQQMETKAQEESLDFAIETLLVSDQNDLSEEFNNYVNTKKQAVANYESEKEYTDAQNIIKTNVVKPITYDLPPKVNPVLETYVKSLMEKAKNGEIYDAQDVYINKIVGDLKSQGISINDDMHNKINAKLATAYDNITTLKQRIAAQETMDRLSGKKAEAAGSRFYESLLESLFPNDKESQENFKKKYPNIEAVEAKFGETINKAVAEKNGPETAGRTNS